MPPRPKRSRRSPQRPRRFPPALLLGGVALLLAILAATGYYLPRHHAPEPPATVTATVKKRPAAAPPRARQQAVPHQQPAAPPAPQLHPPRMALIIDDMGYHDKIGDALLDLHLDLSFAFLPFAPHTQRQRQRAQQLQRDILLHLPMEATDPKWDPGPGALFIGMPASELRHTVTQDLAAVPGAIGINNHMGSLFTANEPAMQTFLAQLRPHRLFFLDSMTTPKSVGFQLATRMGVPVLRRNIFLDNEQHKDKIKKQLDALAFLAKKQGIAIGIAHPHQATLEALREFQRQQDQTVRLVGIHHLIDLP